jgi:peptidoglycan hydrolase-like protein with peptidoglycan-binding domain
MARFETQFPPYHPFGSRTLRSGNQGTDVALVQVLYNTLVDTITPVGVMGGSIPVTGRFDTPTVNAVKRMQSYFGLVNDGIVGPDTYWLWGQGIGRHTTYGGPVFGSRMLALGDRGGDVTILKNRLNLFRYVTVLGTPVTDRFDAAVSAALKLFRDDATANGDTGIPADPHVGFALYDALWLYTWAGGRALLPGRNGLDVAFIQRLLSRLDLYTGPTNGFYDAATIQAVREFQRSRGLTMDGVAGPDTFAALGQTNLVAAPRPFPVGWPPGAPAVDIVSVPLQTATEDLHPYGSAAHVRNLLEGFESLNVTGNTLPDPGQFGDYNGYGFRYTDPQTGKVIAEIPLIAVNTVGDWAGSYSPGVKTIPPGVISVLPRKESVIPPAAPVILTGQFR